MKTGDVAKTGLITISPEEGLVQALQKMRLCKIHHLVVTAPDADPGLISSEDILFEGFDEATGAIRQDLQVKDLMRQTCPRITAQTDMGEAIHLMLSGQQTGLPIEREDGSWGILTRTDLLRLLSARLEEGESGKGTDAARIQRLY